MSKTTGTTKVPTGYRELIETQKEFFRIVEEFFERVTGNKPAEFSALEKFGEEIKKNAQTLATRAADAFGFANRVSAAALMVPSLAPFLPALSAGAAALKYLSDKMDGRKERKEHANSLLGVLAAASEAQDS
jgi:hypothetical protein